MSGTITFDELFPVSDNPNTGFRLFGFNQADTKNEAITISQIIALLELTAPAWSEITGKPTSFPPSAHSFGSHSQVDPSVDTAPDGRLLRRQGGIWGPWTPNFLTSESDPTVPAHVKGITETEKANWNSAFAWGNHAGNYRPVNWVPSWAQVTDKPTTFAPSAHTLGSHSNVDDAIDSATSGQLVRRGATQFEAWTPNYLTSETDPVFGASPAASITIGEIALWNAKLNEWADIPDNTIPVIRDGVVLDSGIIGIYTDNPLSPEDPGYDPDFVPELVRLQIPASVSGSPAANPDEFVTLSQLPTGNHSDLNLNDGTNPHGTTKSDVGLGNVDNTSDLNKPISTATQTALNQKANTADLAEVAISGDYEDLINAPIPFFDLDFTWEFDGNKTYTFPSSFELVRINWVSLFGIILPKDNIAYTVNPTPKTLTLGSLYTPSNGDKLIISARLINA